MTIQYGKNGINTSNFLETHFESSHLLDEVSLEYYVKLVAAVFEFQRSHSSRLVTGVTYCKIMAQFFGGSESNYIAKAVSFGRTYGDYAYSGSNRPFQHKEAPRSVPPQTDPSQLQVALRSNQARPSLPVSFSGNRGMIRGPNSRLAITAPQSPLAIEFPTQPRKLITYPQSEEERVRGMQLIKYDSAGQSVPDNSTQTNNIRVSPEINRKENRWWDTLRNRVLTPKSKANDMQLMRYDAAYAAQQEAKHNPTSKGFRGALTRHKRSKDIETSEKTSARKPLIRRRTWGRDKRTERTKYLDQRMTNGLMPATVYRLVQQGKLPPNLDFGIKHSSATPMDHQPPLAILPSSNDAFSSRFDPRSPRTTFGPSSLQSPMASSAISTQLPPIDRRAIFSPSPILMRNPVVKLSPEEIARIKQQGRTPFC